jgi:dienelactone hydrolase
VFGQPLPGTAALTETGDLADKMIAGLDRFVSREVAASVAKRSAFWNRDTSSPAAYEKSVASNRERFRTIIGAIDKRPSNSSVELVATIDQPALIAQTDLYKVYAVRWPALDGVYAEGLLLEPAGSPVARIVALPDAAHTPEMIAGLTPGIAPESQFARRLAESGCQVLVPVLIDRSSKWSGTERFGFTKQPHREFIYRMAFEMGRHLIGYEVQKVQAAVDWFSKQSTALPIGVAGHGEGGLIALYSAAIDTRISATLVSGYFEAREGVWQEPLYRNVWALLKEFGDAEIASLVAPRALLIEAAKGPEDPGPPPVAPPKRGDTPGRLRTPPVASVRAEVDRARPVFASLKSHLDLITSGDGTGPAGSEPVLAAFLKQLKVNELRESAAPGVDARKSFDAPDRQRRQFEELVDYTQALVRESPFVRQAFWSKADATSIQTWEKSLPHYRKHFWEEVLGKVHTPYLPLSAETRKAYDRPHWTGYEVKIPVWGDVFAYGVLLIPKDLKPGEQRPVVVCQHGNEGRPQTAIDTDPKRRRPWVSELADRGFIVYAPQNPYIFQERFRTLNRKGNPLKLSLYSFILGQHQQTLEWLARLPFVDESRIGFYGISYGGKTAVRVPPLLDRYAVSIASADFGEYVWKMTGLDMKSSFMYTQEYEMYEWNLGNTFNYSDMVSMFVPRPFMVERGHHDTVSIDEWVGYEYAKVFRRYSLFGIPDRTEIEWFNGPHTIHGEGTYRFLHKHLRWSHN